MDNAVALVQAYLRINGYFTVTEYPVFEVTKGGGYSAATDLDVLAFRFPGAGRPLAGGAGGPGGFAPDPILGAPGDRPDMIIGEVKEGKAELNRAAPWILGGAAPASRWSDAIVGALVILLSLRRGPVGERYGSWERFIR